MMLAYRIETTPDDNDTWLVTCPDLPEVTTFAESEGEELVRRAAEAIEEALGARIAAGLEIPTPTSVSQDAMHVAPALLTVLKVELYRACKEKGVTRAWLARELGWHREQVDRLFRLDHASRVDQIESALAKLGRSFAVETRAA